MSAALIPSTGLKGFLIPRQSLAISHKVGGDNMSLMEVNKDVLHILGALGVTQSVCVSAFRSSSQDFNTTSRLIEAGKSQNRDKIFSCLGEISDFHSELLEEILLHSPVDLRNSLTVYSRELFKEYKEQPLDSDLENCNSISDYMVGVGKQSYSLLSIGEVIAAKVLVKYLQLQGIPAVYIDTLSFSQSGNNLGEEVEGFLGNNFQRIFKENPQAIPIIPGYIGGIKGGILSRLGRGYTDYTGSRSAVALHDSGNHDKVLLYIQKLFGFKSTDPRTLGSNAERAQSVNELSYDLTIRAIKGAQAGLINSHSIDERTTSRNIEILVGNPTDSSDIARINRVGNSKAQGVELVLGRDYDTQHDHKVYGRNHPNNGEQHIIYLMGDNIGNLGEIYARANRIMKESGITATAGEIRMSPQGEISLLFKNKAEALRAQRLLHREFIEKT